MVQYGVEGSSTFLECQARSPHALIKWHLQRDNSDRRKEVSQSQLQRSVTVEETACGYSNAYSIRCNTNLLDFPLPLLLPQKRNKNLFEKWSNLSLGDAWSLTLTVVRPRGNNHLFWYTTSRLGDVMLLSPFFINYSIGWSLLLQAASNWILSKIKSSLIKQCSVFNVCVCVVSNMKYYFNKFLKEDHGYQDFCAIF